MKCCSVKIADLEKHYQRMSKRFYHLNGLNDPSLKNTYVASLPVEIQPELNRMTIAIQKDFTSSTIGQIHQMTLEAVDKLCRQHKFFADIMNQKSKFDKACKKSYLEIKCKKSCSGNCSRNCSKKKKGKENLEERKKRKSFKFFKKKKFRGRRNDQRCFIYNKKGHFSKNCPQQKDKAIRLISTLNLSDSEEVESIYSEQSYADEETAFALVVSSEESFDSETGKFPVFSTQEMLPVNLSTPQPCVDIQLLPSKYDKAIKVIAYLDTGAHKSMMDPDILPKEFWKKEVSYFVAADGKIFKTELITKHPIGIKFFPNCLIWTKVIGSKLPNKDILIGMDIYSAAHKLQIHSSGVKFKKEFKAFTDVPRLFVLTEAPPDFQEIRDKLALLCADNHEEFSHPKPLWKNPEFFVQLPFKLNEDVNPTKATHPGMSPTDLLLARKQCNELLRQGLIEPTKSNWACQAFYVEKRLEKLRGKKRLVIDYKPLNQFLRDDKFSIPKSSSLPILLKEALIFSKFDLKSGFWQLGIDPVDRYKTAFCIPYAQYQWTVMPFGLKVAPSLFQKTMTKIFEPILDRAIIYIDDILLFSQDMDSHQRLLKQFFQITDRHGIMLSEKKIHLAQKEIDFLGMHLPQPHIAEELINFPDENLTVKQIQQFLGILNYIRDFIPHAAKYTSLLSKLLKKNPPPWGPEQTKAIQELKKIAQTFPALKIP